ncbi:RHS repeat protein [Zooshikella sp. WH53]|uniref:RHS repeat protein n=2 Tax=Zooshikella harenae TaxID=2827238 RepID=A0ABS5ZJ68_9GAMM|nr:RHS repeat protein [Zooshikella harenae]
MRTVSLERPDGRIIRFSYINDQWQADADVFSSLKTCEEGFCFTQGLRTEKYNNDGKIISIEHPNKPSISFEYSENKITISSEQGQQLILTFNSTEQLIAAEIPNGIKYEYTYDDENRLTARVFEDKNVEYHYENSQFPNYITRIIDERGVIRNRVEYDTQGRAVLSELADSAEKSTLKFNNDNSTTVTNSLGKATTYYFTVLNGVRKPTRVEGHASANCIAANRDYTYYDNGLLKSKTDWKGITTAYQYNNRGLVTRQVVAEGTPQAQVTTTEWHDTFRLPAKVTQQGITTEFTYDEQGRLVQQRQVSSK